MHRVAILTFSVLLAASGVNCAGGGANPVGPSALADSASSSQGGMAGIQARGGGGGGGGKGGTGSGGGTLSLVMVEDVNANTLPNRGDSVTFNISTSVTTQPYVELICRQSGEVVFGKVAGYFEGYPWPWSQVMLLQSDLWVGGAADCAADLYYFNGLKRTSLTVLRFTAYE